MRSSIKRLSRAVTVSCLFALSLSTTASAAPTQEVHQFAKKFAHAFITGDAATGIGMLADDLKFCQGASPYLLIYGCYKGKADFIRAFQQFAAVATSTIELRDIAASETTAYIRVRELATWKATKVSVKVDVIWALQIDQIGNELKVTTFDIFETLLPIPKVKNQ